MFYTMPSKVRTLGLLLFCCGEQFGLKVRAKILGTSQMAPLGLVDICKQTLFAIFIVCKNVLI